VLDPEDRTWYRYRPNGEWTRIIQDASQMTPLIS
jgi:hypothetical protein